jgi:hypothetical protein
VTVRTPIRYLAALLLGGATAVLVACGGSTAGLIPPSNADELNGHLKDIASAVDDGRCGDAAQAGAALAQAVKALPASVDQRITLRLVSGTNRLEQHIPIDCAAAVPNTTTSTTATTTTASTTDTTDTTATTDTTPTTDTQATETIATDETIPTIDTLPDDTSGGVTAP